MRPFYFLFIFVFSTFVYGNEEEPALWELGLGAGYLQFQQYPASSQSTHFMLPFPTFQYRGEVLRADERDGARAFVLKNDSLSLEFSGTIVPPAKSEDNDARQGMEDLRTSVQVGPQLTFKVNDDIEWRTGVFQSISSDLLYTRANGLVYETRLVGNFSDIFSNIEFFRENSLKIKAGIVATGASQEFLSSYYSVAPKDVMPWRSAYDARAGFLSYEFFYFQSIRFGRTSIYCGFSNSHYELSANRDSPLHRANQGWTYFGGIAYTVLESRRDAVPDDATRGILNRKLE